MNMVAAVCLIAVVVLVAIVMTQYYTLLRKIEKETSLLLQSASKKANAPLSEKQLQQLPTPVANWLKLSGILECKPIGSVTVTQEGLLRIKPMGQWMPFHAEQQLLLAKPAFIWKARIKAAPGITILGRDLYLDGQADMLIKLLGVFTVGRAHGYEIAQGSLVRYLAEMVWYPQVVLSPYISWEKLDHDKAKAIISYKGISASGIFYFHESGMPSCFIAQRYKEASGTFTLEEWSVRMDGYKSFQGILIPTQGEVSWNLQNDPFHWLQFMVVEAQFEEAKNH